MATRLTDLINEAVKTAQNSHDPDTRISRLSVAKSKLAELQRLAREHPFIHLEQLHESKALIAKLESEFTASNLREIADGNLRGKELEGEGKVEEAVAIYERLLAKGIDTPFTYRRLAIIYSKQKRRKEELRVLRTAVENVPIENSKHYKWFAERLAKKSK